jgi:hypothetical protein
MRWIVIPNWDGDDGFQHYKDRDPIWIKNYRRLLNKDEYLELSFHQRGILHSLWLAYAASNRQLIDNTSTLNRQLGHRVTRHDLETLNHAGFIRFSASKPLAQRKRKRETSKEVSLSREKRRARTARKRAAAAAPTNGGPAAAPKKKTAYERARDWVLVAGWQLDDIGLHEMLGHDFGIDQPARGQLVALAHRAQQADP